MGGADWSLPGLCTATTNKNGKALLEIERKSRGKLFAPSTSGLNYQSAIPACKHG